MRARVSEMFDSDDRLVPSEGVQLWGEIVSLVGLPRPPKSLGQKGLGPPLGWGVRGC